MQVIFVVDANHEAGMGHISRCVTTANAIARSQSDVSVRMLAIDGALPLSVEADDRIEFLAPTLAETETRPESVLPASRHEVLLVVDHYGLLESDWLHRFRDRLPKVPVLAFDDLSAGEEWPTLGRISVGIGSPTGGVSTNSKSGNAVGPSFFPMRNEINRSLASPLKAKHKAPIRILVALGGADSELHTERLVNILARLSLDAQFDIVFGPGASAARATQAAPDHRFIPHHCPKNFPNLMAAADLALTGGGNTCNELLFLGVPVMAFCLAKNQVPTCEALAREDCGHYAGQIDLLSDGDIAEQLQFLIAHPSRRAEMAQRGQALVDGKGGDRLADFIVGSLKAYFSDEFSENGVREEYDDSATETEEHNKVRWGSAESMQNRMRLAIARIDWASVSSWADIGTATGLLLVLAEKTEKIKEFVGIDLSEKLLDSAKSRTYSTNTVRFERQSFMSKLAGEPFSLVTALGVLQKCGLSIELAMARIGEMTIPGGQVFLTTKNAAWNRFDDPGFKPYQGHHWFDPERLRNACRWAGLEILSTGSFDAAKNEIDNDFRAHSNLYIHARKLKW